MNNFKQVKPHEVRKNGLTTIELENMRGKVQFTAAMPDNIELISKFSDLLTKNDYATVMNHLNKL